MSLHVKKINRQFSVLKKARVIGLFSCTGETNIVEVPGPTQIVTSDCPVMSGFFHAHKGVYQFSCVPNGMYCDCPVMSGFFHTLKTLKSYSDIELHMI